MVQLALDSQHLSKESLSAAAYMATRDDHLQLIVLPTEQCNFRCTYCYEDFSIGKMTPEVVSGIIAFLRKRFRTLSVLSIEWFGGEPLLGIGVIRSIMGSIAELKESHSAVDVRSSITTNGYLLSTAVFEELVGLGVRSLQVTVDGPAQSHNRSRPRQDGRGTFDRIWSNLRHILASDAAVEVILRVNVDAINVEDVRSWIPDLRALNQDARVTVQFQAVGKWGGPRDRQLQTLESSSKASVLRDLEFRLSGYPTATSSSKSEMCYASHANSLVVRADGRLAKCTVALSDRRNDIGFIGYDGTITIDNSRLQPWLMGLTTGEVSDLECPLLGMTESRKRRLLPLAVI
jgi:uncharacterized protein